MISRCYLSMSKKERGTTHKLADFDIWFFKASDRFSNKIKKYQHLNSVNSNTWYLISLLFSKAEVLNCVQMKQVYNFMFLYTYVAHFYWKELQKLWFTMSTINIAETIPNNILLFILLLCIWGHGESHLSTTSHLL